MQLLSQPIYTITRYEPCLGFAMRMRAVDPLITNKRDSGAWHGIWLIDRLGEVYHSSAPEKNAMR